MPNIMFQLGLDVKTVPTEELTETVEIVDEVDEEQAIEDEVRQAMKDRERHSKLILIA